MDLTGELRQEKWPPAFGSFSLGRATTVVLQAARFGRTNGIRLSGATVVLRITNHIIITVTKHTWLGYVPYITLQPTSVG